MLILGLDPGSLRTGFGLVEKQGSRLKPVEQGCISCPSGMPLPQRLAKLTLELDELVSRRRPAVAALETAFHGRNSKSLIVLAQARGALLAVLGRHGLEIREHSPAEVKSAITGSGRASKEQVARMVQLLLRVDTAKLRSDTTDAMAVAICCAQRLRFDRLRTSEGVP